MAGMTSSTINGLSLVLIHYHNHRIVLHATMKWNSPSGINNVLHATMKWNSPCGTSMNYQSLLSEHPRLCQSHHCALQQEYAPQLVKLPSLSHRKTLVLFLLIRVKRGILSCCNDSGNSF
ncbi:hypothetical protein SeMB42_g04668 [Synchytrium endobioticum]|uniref:Uncharacterized protein n=1 Tax=Synchytrium endobioticum TaxID=286115 RepID=A0A507CWL4_9FUNG|nr:hypothetical protein SeMB42_g04668 [Synchytrium endobioticum]